MASAKLSDFALRDPYWGDVGINLNVEVADLATYGGSTVIRSEGDRRASCAGQPFTLSGSDVGGLGPEYAPRWATDLSNETLCSSDLPPILLYVR